MVIYGVSFDMVGKQPIVLLKAVDTNKFLPIWIGHPEAAAILMKLQGASTPRPMTHDLLFDMLAELEVDCTRVSVTELRENTFYASITLSINGREVEIDSRPSDALALAVRSGAPIFAGEDVIAESAIEFEHEVEDTRRSSTSSRSSSTGHARGLPRPRAVRAAAAPGPPAPGGRGRQLETRRSARRRDPRASAPAAAATFGQPRDRVGLEHRQLAVAPRASGRRARSRSTRAAVGSSASSGPARSSPTGSAGRNRRRVRPIS
jgi:bifunctional DNase/RNase